MGVFDYLPNPKDVWSGATNGGLTNAWHNIDNAFVTKTDTSPIKTQTDKDLALADSLAAQRAGQTPTASPQTGGFAVGGTPGATLGNAPPSPTDAAARLSAINPHDTSQTRDVNVISATGKSLGPPPGTTVVNPAAQADATTINTQQSDQTRDQQQGALAGLRDAANGAVPSAAQIQQQQGLDRALASQYALASALGGRSAGGALRTASRGAANLQQAAISDAAALRANEQAQARNAYAQTLQGVRSQDQDQAQAQAALTQGNNQFNTQQTNTLQNKVLDANAQSQLANLNAKLTTMGLDEHEREALLSAQLQAMGYAQSGANAIVGANAANAAADNQFKGGLISTGASLLSMLSDAREKTDVKDADMSDFLDKLQPYTYRYKDPGKEGAAPGKRIGFMAQDAAKSDVGRSLVVDGERMKIDVSNALGAALAAASALHKRVRKLEAR